MTATGLRHLSWLGVLGAVAVLPFLAAPAMVGIIVDDLGMRSAGAGWLASVNFLGYGFASIFIALRVHGLHLQRVGIAGMSIVLSLDLASVLLGHHWVGLFVARFLAGLGAGAVYASVLAATARSTNPDRGFGLLITVQFVVSGISLYALPVLASDIGAPGMFLIFAGCDVIALALTRYLPAEPALVLPDAASGELGILLTAVALLAVLGLGLYEAANSAQFTYTERIGVVYGFSAEQIGLSLGVASFLGIPGAFGIVVLGARFGRLLPLLFGVAVSVLAVLMLLYLHEYHWYFLSMCMLGAAWAFTLPYLYAVLGAIDPKGSAVAAGSFSSWTFSAAGPAIAAAVLGSDQYARVLWLTILLFTLALACIAMSHRLTRTRGGAGTVAGG